MGSITEESLRVAARAMAIADEEERHPWPSFSSQRAEVKHGPTDYLSIEDIIWADSCLQDPDADQIDWNSWDAFRLTLSETFSSETDSPVTRIENHAEGFVVEISPSRQPIGSRKILGTRADGDSSITKGAVDNSRDELTSGQIDIFPSETDFENALLPTWNENLGSFAASDPEEGVDFPGFLMEQSTEDIFKVWDLDLPSEEDELVNQLKKALAQNSLEPSPSVSNDFRMLKDIAVDDIISGISELSLSRFPM